MKRVMEKFITIVLITISAGLLTGYNSGIKDQSVCQPNIVNDYMFTLTSNGIDLPFGCDLVLVDFSLSLPSNVLGVAFGMEIDNVTVVSINAYKWFQLTPNQQKLLLFHELSHDIFNLYHFSTPIMNTPMPMHVTDDYLKDSIDKLIHRLRLR